MALQPHDFTVHWHWTGDPWGPKGFNVAVCEDGDDPASQQLVQVFVKHVPEQTSYTVAIPGVNAAAGTHKAYVQAVYAGDDSDWLASTGQTVADDGAATIAAALGLGTLAGLGSADYTSNVSGTKPPANATANTLWWQSGDPGFNAHDGDIWVDSDDKIIYIRYSGGWRTAEGAIWSSISGTGKPADSATKNTLYNQASDPGGANGDFWYDTDAYILYEKISGSWVSTGSLGAPSGTNVGGTAATTVEANAANGQTAYGKFSGAGTTLPTTNITARAVTAVTIALNNGTSYNDLSENSASPTVLLETVTLSPVSATESTMVVAFMANLLLIHNGAGSDDSHYIYLKIQKSTDAGANYSNWYPNTGGGWLLVAGRTLMQADQTHDYRTISVSHAEAAAGVTSNLRYRVVAYCGNSCTETDCYAERFLEVTEFKR